MPLPDTAASDWLVARLRDPTNRPAALGEVYRGWPPQGATDFPCVVYFLSAGLVNRVLGPDRTLSPLTYTVKVIAPGEASEELRPYVDWIDGQLQNADRTPYPPPVLAADALEVIDTPHVGPDGVVWQQYGARYQLWVTAELPP